MKETFPKSFVMIIADMVGYADGGVVSKQVLKNDAGNITLFSFDEGQGLSEHTAPFDALVQNLEGEVEIVLAGQPLRLKRGESVIMPGKMRGDVLLDFAGGGDLLQVEIILRVAHHRQQVGAVSPEFIFFFDAQRNIEKLNLCCGLGLYSVRIYPESAIIVGNQIFIGQCGSRGVIVAGEAAKQEDVSNFLESFAVRFKVNDLFKFHFRKVAPVFLYLFEFVVTEEIFRHLAVLEAYSRDALENPHQFFG